MKLKPRFKPRLQLKPMKIVDRYIFTGYIGNFFISLAGMLALIIIADIFSFIDEILKARIPVQDLVTFYLYQSPLFLIHITPIACLISSVYILGNLNKHNEIVAMRTSGISIWRTMAPIFLATVTICVGVFLVNNMMVPKTTRVANKIRFESLDIAKRGKKGIKEMRNVALFASENKIIYVTKMDVTGGILYNMIIQKNDQEERLISKITAESAAWRDGHWAGRDVAVYDLDGSGRIIGVPQFLDKMELPIAETPMDFINNQWQPEYMSYRQLKRYIHSFGRSSRNTLRRLFVDLYHKTSFPFTSLVMVLVSASFALTTARGGALLGMAKGVVIALLYIPVMAVGIALGKSGLFHPLLGAWFSNIVFGITGVWMLNRRQ